MNLITSNQHPKWSGMLVCCVYVLVVLGGQTATAIQWCPGNVVVSGTVSDTSVTSTFLGADSELYNAVAINGDFRFFTHGQLPNQPTSDLLIYSFPSGESMVPTPIELQRTQYQIGRSGAWYRPRLVYDGETMMIIYNDGNLTSSNKNGIVSRVVNPADGSLEPPKFISKEADYSQTGTFRGFEALSRPLNSDIGQISMLVAHAPEVSRLLQIEYYDQGFAKWRPSFFSPQTPKVSGGVAMGTSTNRIMVCAVSSEFGIEVICFISGNSGFTGDFTRVAAAVPLTPFQETAEVFVASCGSSNSFVVGTASAQGQTSIVVTTNGGSSWSASKIVPGVGPSSRSQLVGFVRSGVCTYSFSYFEYGGDIKTITSDANMNWLAANSELLYTTSNDYFNPAFVSDFTKTLFGVDRPADDPSDNTYFKGCKMVVTSTPTSFPTAFPTSKAPTLPTKAPTIATKAPSNPPSTPRPTKYPVPEPTYRPTIQRLIPTIPRNEPLQGAPDDVQNSPSNTAGIIAGVLVSCGILAVAVGVIIKRRRSVSNRLSRARESVAVTTAHNFSSVNPHFSSSADNRPSEDI